MSFYVCHYETTHSFHLTVCSPCLRPVPVVMNIERSVKQESLANAEVSARQLCRFEMDCEMKLRIKVIVWSFILQSITRQQRQYIAK